MNPRGRDCVALPVFDSKQTGFKTVLDHFGHSTDPVLMELSRFIRNIDIVFVIDPCDALPLPDRLTPSAILTECRKMRRKDFPFPDGKAFHKYMTSEGYTILSWPDQTKTAVRFEPGVSYGLGHAQRIYLAGRLNRETYLGKLAAEGGDPCISH